MLGRPKGLNSHMIGDKSSGGNLWCHILTLLMNWGFPWVKGNKKKFSIIFHRLYLAKSLCKSVANCLNWTDKLKACQVLLSACHPGTMSWHLKVQNERRRLSRAVQQPQWFWLRFHIHTCCCFIHRALQCLIVTFDSLIVNLKLATVSDLQVSGITFEAHLPKPQCLSWATSSLGSCKKSKSCLPLSITWVGWAWRVCVQLGALWSPGLCAAGRFLIRVVIKKESVRSPGLIFREAVCLINRETKVILSSVFI